VLQGSTARKSQSETFPAGHLVLRDKLVAGGQRVDDPSASVFRFAADGAFRARAPRPRSLPAASASGPLEWKVVGSGQSYRDWRAATLA